MFIVKAGDAVNFRLNIPRSKAFEYFSDPINYERLLDNVSDVHRTSKGQYTWSIRAQIPMVGAYSQDFLVREAEMSENLIEWIPASGESENLLRVTTELRKDDDNETEVKFGLIIELRRRTAMSLHMLAGLAGDKTIGEELGKEIASILEQFSKNVRDELNR